MIDKHLQKELPERFPSPRQYFAGQKRNTLTLPDNIMIFCRDRRVPAEARDPLAHHRHVMLIILAGTGSIVINGERFALRPGYMLLLLPHQLHLTFYDQEKVNWLYVTFELADSTPWTLFANRTTDFPQAATPYLADLLDCRIVESGADSFEGTRAALNIAQILNAAARAHAQSSQIKEGHAPLQRLLSDRINNYLYRNLEKPLDMGALSCNLGYSQTHLRRIYNQCMGISIGKYLRSMRHAHAQTLLREGYLSLHEIARQCGYGSVYAFGNAFKSKEKTSPGAFRKRFRNPNATPGAAN